LWRAISAAAAKTDRMMTWKIAERSVGRVASRAVAVRACGVHGAICWK
jgi:hypothetical protein